MQIDSTSVAVGQQVSNIGALLIGAGAAVATKFVKVGATWTEKQLGGADQAVTKALGPVWPVVAGALAIGLPLAGNALGVTDLPSAAVIANAPLSGLLAVVLRETFKRVFPGGR